VKNCFPVQNFTEIGQSAAELWLKTSFNMAIVRRLEFKNFNIWSYGCNRVPNLLSCTKFHQNHIIFRRDMAISRFSIWQISAILNYRKRKEAAGSAC